MAFLVGLLRAHPGPLPTVSRGALTRRRLLWGLTPSQVDATPSLVALDEMV